MRRVLKDREAAAGTSAMTMALALALTFAIPFFAQIFGFAGGADLAVQGIAVPASMSTDSRVSINATVANIGDAPASNISVEFYINGTLFATEYVSQLASGGSLQVIASLNTSKLAGNYTVEVKIDPSDEIAELNEANNILTESITVQAAPKLSDIGPDLTIAEISWTPAPIGYEDLVTFNATVKNAGDIDVVERDVCVGFFVDGNYIGDACANVTIVANGNISFETTWPAMPGTHDITAWADYYDNIGESDETNNNMTVILAYIPGPDLIVTNITWTPETIGFEDTVIFNASVKNVGDVDVVEKDICLAIYIDGSYIGDFCELVNISVDETVFFEAPWTADLSGYRSVTAIADAYNNVDELDETNNQLTVPVYIAGPDLIVANVTWSPDVETFTAGDLVKFNATVKNIGERSVSTPAYIRVDFWVDGNYIGWNQNYTALRVDETTVVTIGYYITPGNKTNVTAIVDRWNSISEINETNNAFTKPFLVQVLAPDLIVSNITWSPLEIDFENYVYFNFSVTNIGDANVTNKGIYVYYYFDRDISYNGYDGYVYRYGNISANETVFFNTSWWGPWLARGGYHNITARAGSYSWESNQTNNRRTADLPYIPGPDLIVTNITWTPDVTAVTAKDTVIFNATIENIGERNISARTIYVRFWVDGIDIGTGSKSTSLPINGSTWITRSWTIPAGNKTNVTAMVDPGNGIGEINETNNSLTKAFPMQVLAPDLVISNITTIPYPPREGESATINVTISNLGDGSYWGGFYSRILVDGTEVAGPYLQNINTSRFDFAASYVSQRDYVTMTAPTWWGSSYIFTKEAFAREANLTFQAKFKAAASGDHTMIGWKDSTAGYSYTDMPHALYFTDGALHIYEDGNWRTTGGTGLNYNLNTWYDAKVVLKPAGAEYYYKQADSENWTSVYFSTYSSESNLRPGITAYGSTRYTDDWIITGDNGTLFSEDFSAKTIEASGTRNVYANWTATRGNHSITARVDFNNDVWESNETNNQLTVNITPLQGPTFNWIRTSPEYPNINQNITVLANITDDVAISSATLYYSPANVALQFDGVNDYVDCGNDSSLNISYDITVEAWIKAATTQPDTHFLIIDKSHGFTDYTGWCLQGFTSSGNIAFGLGTGTEFPYTQSTTNFKDNTWHHVVGTYDRSQIRIYVDGKLEGSPVSYTAAQATNDRIVEIGRAWGGGTPKRYFNGIIDEARIYNRSLSASEIQQRYENNADIREGLVLELKFNESHGNIANDSSGNNNNGTIYGATWVEGKILRWNSLAMTNAGDIYSAVIPGYSNTTKVYYYISATDSDSITLSSSIKSFIADGEPPRFVSIDTLPRYPNATVNVSIIPNIQDNVGIANVTLYYSYDNINWNSAIINPLDPSTRLLMRFNEGSGTTAYDESPYRNDGKINGATWTDGISGKALKFDGVDDYVQTPLSSNIQPLTIEVWFKSNVNTGEHSIVDSDISGQSGQSIILGYWDGDNTLDVQYHDGWYDSPFVVEVGVWYHAVAIFTPGKVELYVNGNFIGSKEFTQGALNGDNFRIGRHNPGDPQWFNGIIDEVAIYDRVLTAEEIQQHFNSGLSSGRGLIPPPNYTTEVYYYINATDLSGNKNSSVMLSYLADGISPAINWVTNVTGIQSYQLSIPILTNVSDNQGFDSLKIWYSTDNQSWNYSLMKPIINLISWKYRKPIYINNSLKEDLADYQIRININYTPGMQSDFDDLRFTQINSTSGMEEEIPYWIENYVEKVNASVWVKVPLVQAESIKTIYVYYGDPSSATASNGNATFEFFDDFEGGSLDWNKWEKASGELADSEISVANSILTIEGTGTDNEYLKTKTFTTNRPIILRAKQRDYTTYAYPCEFGFGYRNYMGDSNGVLKLIYTADKFCLLNHAGTGESYTDGVADDDNYHIWELIWTSSETGISRDLASQGSLTTNIPDASLYISLGHPETMAPNTWKGSFDWILVRKYTSQEPAISIGSEENISIDSAIFKGIIPPTYNTTPVYYYLEVKDMALNTVYSHLYSYVTSLPPKITNVTHLPAYPNGFDSVTISANITDDGYVTSAYTYYGVANYTNALQFDGVDDHVLIPDSTSLDLTTHFTFDAWVFPKSSGDLGVISKVGGSTGNKGYQFGLTGSSVFCHFNAEGEAWPANSLVAGTVSVNQWTHIACAYDNYELKIYVNGVLKGSKVISNKSVANSASNLRISMDDNNNVPFNGIIDEVRIYNRSLTAEEILERYRNDTNIRSGLAAEYKFDEGSGSFANDSSGNNNNGTIYGATWITREKPVKFWNSLAMSNISSIYSATIPATGYTGKVYYYLTATDNLGFISITPTYTYISDLELPQFIGVSIYPQYPNATTNVTVSVDIKDNVGVANATLYYSYDNITWNSTIVNVTTGLLQNYSVNEISHPFESASETIIVSGDDTYGTYALPFSFPFYNSSYNSIYVGTNGFISFDSGNGWFYENLPGYKQIAVDVRDLVTTVYAANHGDYVTIRWYGRLYGGGGGNRNLATAELHSNGKIILTYSDYLGGYAGVSSGDNKHYTQIYPVAARAYEFLRPAAGLIPPPDISTNVYYYFEAWDVSRNQNYSRIYTYYTGEVDLIAENITVSGALAAGSEVEISAGVKNLGPGDILANTSVGFLVDNNYIGKKRIGKLNASESAIAAINWTAVGGKHNISARADYDNEFSETNETNNEVTIAVEISRDMIPPVFGDITQVPANVTRATIGKVDIYVNITDVGAGVDPTSVVLHYAITTSKSTSMSLTAGLYKASITENWSSLTGQNLSYYISASDLAGNSNVSQTIIDYIDPINTIPSVSIITPHLTTAYKDEGIVIWRIVDDDSSLFNSTLSYRRAGQNWTSLAIVNESSFIGSGTYQSQYTWDTSHLSEGYYELLINVSDGIDSTSSVSETFAIDRTGPYSISLISPADIYTSGEPTTFKFIAADNLDSVLTCNLTLDGINRTTLQANNNALTSANIYGVPDGTHSWSVTCWDNAFNANSSETKSFRVERGAPTVTVYAPMDGAIIDADTVEFNFTAYDTISETLACSIILNGETKATLNVTRGTFALKNIIGLSSNTYTWYISCKDDAGNNGTSPTRKFNVTTDLGLASEDIEFSNPMPIEGSSITVNITIHNHGKVNATIVVIKAYDESKLIGERTISVQALGQTKFSIPWNLVGLPAGMQNATVIINQNPLVDSNLANNTAKNSININLDSIPPVISRVIVPDIQENSQNVTIEAEVTDVGVGVNTVYLYYKIETLPAWQNKSMAKVAADKYRATLSKEEVDWDFYQGKNLTYYVNASDKNNNYNQSPIEKEYIDIINDLPKLIIHTPNKDRIWFGIITINFTCDNDNEGPCTSTLYYWQPHPWAPTHEENPVEYFKQGKWIKIADLVKEGITTYDWDTASFNGWNRLNITASDGVYTISNLSDIFIIDNTNISITIDNYYDSDAKAYVAAPLPVIYGKVNAIYSNITTLEINNTNFILTVSPVGKKYGNYTFESTTTISTPFSVKINATDEANSYDEIIGNFIIDSLPPVIYSVEFQNTHTNDLVKIVVNASDNYPIDSVTATVPTNIGMQNITLSKVNETFEAEFRGPLIPGTYNVNITARDIAGNAANITATFDITPGIELEVSDIAFEPGIVATGEMVNITALINNTGGKDAFDVNVSILADSRYIATLFANVSQNSSAAIPFNWDTTGFAGSVNITVKIENVTGIYEVNYTNNILSKPYYIKASDLIVASISFSPPPPTYSGLRVAIYADIANTEGVNATWVRINFYRNNTTEDNLVGYTYIDVLANSTTRAQVEWRTSGLEGNQTIIVWINPYNLPAELNTSDNKASAIYQIEEYVTEKIPATLEFQKHLVAALSGEKIRGLASGNFDGDTRIDFAIGTDKGNIILFKNFETIIENRTKYVNFTSAVIDNLGEKAYGMTSGDYYNDGYQDLVVGIESGKVILYNNTNGIFTKRELFDTGDYAYGLTTADYDGDGDLDIVAGNKLGHVSLYLNDNMTFTFSRILTTREEPFGLTSGDYNLDGSIDLMVGDRLGQLTRVTKEFGVYNSFIFADIGAFAHALTTADIDFNGRLDLIAIGFAGEINLFYSREGGLVMDPLIIGKTNNTYGITSADYDADNDIDLIIGTDDGEVYLLLNSLSIIKTSSRDPVPTSRPFEITTYLENPWARKMESVNSTESWGEGQRLVEDSYSFHACCGWWCMYYSETRYGDLLIYDPQGRMYLFQFPNTINYDPEFRYSGCFYWSSYTYNGLGTLNNTSFFTPNFLDIVRYDTLRQREKIIYKYKLSPQQEDNVTAITNVSYLIKGLFKTAPTDYLLSDDISNVNNQAANVKNLNPSEDKTDRDYLDVEIRAPELVAEDMEFFYTGIPIPYKPITITATVNNTRDIAIDNVEIQFIADNKTISQTCTYDPFGYPIECRDVTFNIGALSKAKISYAWTPTTGGTHDITIAVNPAKKIVERNYANNNLTKKFSLEPQADLAPVAVWFNKSEYVEGEPATVYATIENVGKNKSYWGYAVFCDRQEINCTPSSPDYDGGKCSGAVSYPCQGGRCWVCAPVGFGNLEAGENVTINHTFTLADGYSSSQGTHYFSVVTGDVGSGDDDNSNNAIYTTYTVKPSQVNLRYDNCGGWCDPFYFINPADEILKLYLREGNAGGGDAKNYSIRIYYDDNPANLVYQADNLTLKNHTLITRTFDVNWSDVPDGDHTIYAYIDFNNDVNESNEGDNIITTPFKWIDLVADRISFSIEHPQPGDLISISATIRNDGDIRTKEFAVDLYIDGQFTGRKNTSLLAHSQGTVAYNWTVPKSQTVNHDIMIKVDPDDVIKLESEANNVLKKQLSTVGWEMHLLAKGFKHNNLTSYENTLGAFAEKEYNLKDLFMEFHSAPAFADLDNDGDLDLMVGDITGKLRTYKNTGSALNATWVESYWAYGIDAGSYSTPAFADLDNDSDLDLAVGNNFGSLSAYENTGNATNPAWSKVDKWNITKISVSSYAAPAFADLDGDGDLDLIIGSGDGKLYSYENTGNYTWQEIDWTADIDAEQNAAPAFANLDGDGDLDLIVGLKNGTIYSYENIGSASSPIWQMATWTSSIKTGSYAKPALADLDGDGDKDLVIGSNNDGFIPLRAGYTEPIYLELVNYGNFTMTVERVSFELLNKSSGNKITDLFVAPPIIIPALAAIEREFIITPPVDIPENTTLAIVTENVFSMSPAWINNPELGGYTTDVLVDAITTLEISGSYRVLYNDTMSPKFVCSNWCPVYNLTPYKMATIIADSPAGINVYEKERRTNFEIVRPDRAPVTIYFERLGESFSLRPGYVEDIEFTIQNNNKKEYKVDRLTFELYKDGKIYDLYTDTNGFTLPREESIRKTYKFYVPEGVPLNATFILKVGTKYGFPDGSWHRNNINIYPDVAGIGGLGCAATSEDIPLKGRYDVENLTLFTNESSWGAQYFSSGDIFSLMDILAKFNYIIDPARLEEEFNRVLSSPIVGEYLSYFGVTPDIVNIEDVRNVWNQKIHRYHSEIDDASYLRKHIWIPSTLQKAELYQKVTCSCPMGVPEPPSGIITWVNEKNRYGICADLCNAEQKGWTSFYYDLNKSADNYVTLYSYGPSRELEVNFYDLLALDYVHAATDRALEPAFDINVTSIGYKGLLRRGYEEPVNITITNNDDDPFVVKVVEFDLISGTRKIHLLTDLTPKVFEGGQRQSHSYYVTIPEDVPLDSKLRVRVERIAELPDKLWLRDSELTMEQLLSKDTLDYGFGDTLPTSQESNYRKHVFMPLNITRMEMILGAGLETKVYLNGEYQGSAYSGWSPIATQAGLREGENNLISIRGSIPKTDAQIYVGRAFEGGSTVEPEQDIFYTVFGMREHAYIPDREKFYVYPNETVTARIKIDNYYRNARTFDLSLYVTDFATRSEAVLKSMTLTVEPKSSKYLEVNLTIPGYVSNETKLQLSSKWQETVGDKAWLRASNIDDAAAKNQFMDDSSWGVVNLSSAKEEAKYFRKHLWIDSSTEDVQFKLAGVEKLWVNGLEVDMSKWKASDFNSLTGNEATKSQDNVIVLKAKDYDVNVDAEIKLIHFVPVKSTDLDLFNISYSDMPVLKHGNQTCYFNQSLCNCSEIAKGECIYTVNQGDEVAINFTIRNSGELFSNNFTMRAYAGARAIALERISMHPYSRDIWQINWDTSEFAGLYELNVNLDKPEDIVIESSELNNEIARKIYVNAPPKIEYLDIRELYGLNEDIAIKALITDSDSNLESVKFEISLPNGTTLQIEPARANNSSIYNYTYNSSDKGRYTLKAIANDSLGLSSSMSKSFDIYNSLFVNVKTENDTYYYGETAKPSFAEYSNRTRELNNTPPLFLNAFHDAETVKGGSKVTIRTIAVDSDNEVITLYICKDDRVTMDGCLLESYCSAASLLNPSCSFYAESEGNHTWFAFIFDVRGEKAQTSFEGNYTIDTSPPVIELLSVASAKTKVEGLWGAYPYLDNQADNKTLITIKGEMEMKCRIGVDEDYMLHMDRSYSNLDPEGECYVSGEYANCFLALKPINLTMAHISCIDRYGNEQNSAENLDVEIEVSPSDNIYDSYDGAILQIGSYVTIQGYTRYCLDQAGSCTPVTPVENDTVQFNEAGIWHLRYYDSARRIRDTAIFVNTKPELSEQFIDHLGHEFEAIVTISDPEDQKHSCNITYNNSTVEMKVKDGRPTAILKSDSSEIAELLIACSDGFAVESLTTWHKFPNHAPVIRGVPDISLRAYEGKILNLSQFSRDIDGDSLAYLIANQTGNAVNASIKSNLLIINASNEIGVSTLCLIANDSYENSTEECISVYVENLDESEVKNNEVTEMLINVMIKAQYYSNPEWIDLETSYHTVKVDPGKFNQIDLKDIYSYDTFSSPYRAGQFRIYAAVIDENGNVLENRDGSMASSYHNFTLIYYESIPSPPSSISNLTNASYADTYINWTWDNPPDPDFWYVIVYIDGEWKQNVTKPISYYLATGFAPNTTHTISTRTADYAHNINTTWVNHTAMTSPAPPIINYTIAGYVLDSFGEALSSVKVSDNQSRSSALSLTTGYYDLGSSYPNGSYILRFNKTGFDDGNLEVSISGASNLTANMTLYDTTPPTAVTAVSNDTPTQTTVNLTWSAAYDANLWGYEVLLNGIHLAYTQNTYFNVTGLSPGTTYEFRIRAIDKYNNTGESSPPLTITTLPPPPGAIAPSIISRGNNATGSDSLDITVERLQAVKFNATADQAVSWHWYVDGKMQSWNYDNIILSWNSTGEKKVEVNASNMNGTSNTITWKVTVRDTTPPADLYGFANVTTSTSINVTWIQSSDTDHVECWDEAALLFNATKGYWLRTGLSPATLYPMKFRPVDSYGNAGDFRWYNVTTEPAITPVPTPAPAPSIVGYAPPSPVDDVEGAARTFNITINQTVNVTWYINGTNVHTNLSVNEASYTNTSAVIGIWNVSAIAENVNGTAIQTWIWNVTALPVTPTPTASPTATPTASPTAAPAATPTPTPYFPYLGKDYTPAPPPTATPPAPSPTPSPGPAELPPTPSPVPVPIPTPPPVPPIEYVVGVAILVAAGSILIWLLFGRRKQGN